MEVITLEGEVVSILFNLYKDKGYPLGKNIRGRKKWLSRLILNSLIEQSNKVLTNSV